MPSARSFALALALLLPIAAACSRATPPAPAGPPVVVNGVTLPPPFATKSAERSPDVVGWPPGKAPVAPPGFVVKRFAEGLAYPRWLHVLPNGDVLVAEARSSWQRGKSPDRIMLLRDADHDGVAELVTTFAEGLHLPFGMALAGKDLYVANTDGVVRFDYTAGQTKLEGQGRKIVDLSAQGYHGHWTRNVVVDPTGQRLFVSVGSRSNVGEGGMEAETNRACILTCSRDGSGLRVYASGLRNPTGMDFEPKTGALWTAVNERDELGDDLVPDYITSVREGAFYGWPYAYFGPNEDPRRKGERPDLVAKTIAPDVPMGAHTASLGLAFSRGTSFPSEWRGGAFVAQHGSWNRAQLAGYVVVYVPFEDGKAKPPRKDFLTGFFANAEQSSVYGRPVGVAQQADGSLLVADDEGKIVWHVQYAAAMIVVHHLEASRSQRVPWALEELGVPYEVKKYQRDPATMLAPKELRAVHPLGKSPVVTDDGRTYAESGAILEHLVEKYGGKLVPAKGTEEHDRYRYWMHYAEGSAMPPLLLKLIFGRMQAGTGVPFLARPLVRAVGNKVCDTFVDKNLANHLDWIESELGKSTWFAGEELTMADIQMSFPVEAGVSRAGGDAKRPRMAAFVDRIHARDAYKRAIEKGGPFEILS